MARKLNLKFSTTARQDRRLEVCSAKPAKGWVIPEYDGCTFMALNETSDNPDTAARLPDPRHWAVLWLRKGIPPLKSWPGHFLADTHADREVVWTLLAEQIEAGIKRMERSRRDRAGEDTGLLLLDWARDLPVDWQDPTGDRVRHSGVTWTGTTMRPAGALRHHPLCQRFNVRA